MGRGVPGDLATGSVVVGRGVALEDGSHGEGGKPQGRVVYRGVALEGAPQERGGHGETAGAGRGAGGHAYGRAASHAGRFVRRLAGKERRRGRAATRDDRCWEDHATGREATGSGVRRLRVRAGGERERKEKIGSKVYWPNRCVVGGKIYWTSKIR